MSQLKLGAFISYAAIAFNVLAGLLYTPWMISCIGSDNYALYTLVMSVINYFMMDLGLGSAVSRFLSKYYAEGRREKADAFLGIVYRMYLLLDVAIFVILATVFIFSDAIYASLGPGRLATFKVLYAIAVAYSVVSFPFASFDGILVSNERFVWLNLCNLVQKVATVLLIVACLLFGRGVYSLVLVNAAVGVATLLVKGALIRRGTDARPQLRFWDARLAREVLGFSGWVMISQLCQRFIFGVMPSVLAVVSTTWEVTLFGLAYSLEGYVYTVANALNNMFMPEISRVLVGERASEGVQAIAVRVGRLQLYLIGLIIIGFASVGTTFVGLWMGSKYGTLYGCALLLFLPQLFELPQLIMGTAVIAAGEVQAKAKVYTAMAIANVILGALLSSLFGATGACAAICSAYLLRTGGMNVIYHNRLGFDSLSFFRDVYGSWLLPGGVTLAVGITANRLLFGSSWLAFIGEACFVALIYFVLMWTLSFNDYEKGLLKTLFGR